MRKTLLNLAAAAAMVAVSAGAQAGETFANSSGTTVTYSFTGIQWGSGGFSYPATLVSNSLVGLLTSVDVEAKLVDVGPAKTNDLTILVQDNLGTPLQVGGSDPVPYSTLQNYQWSGDSSSTQDKLVTGSASMDPLQPLDFGIPANMLTIAVGNGSAADQGTWTGSITFHGLQLAPVPEPATWAMFAAGAVGLVGWMGRRRKAAVTV